MGRTHATAITIVTLMAASACGASRYVGAYNIRLTEVEKPASFQERFSPRDVTVQRDADARRYSYSDSLISITWLPTASGFGFDLENKTDHSMKIRWDEAAFVDATGSSHRVMHSGVPFLERHSPQAASVVVRKGSVTDFVFPTSNVFFSLDSWDTRAIFPKTSNDRSLLERGQRLVGESVQVLLPIEVQGTVNEYIFRFGVEGFCGGVESFDTYRGWGDPEEIQCWGDEEGLRLDGPEVGGETN